MGKYTACRNCTWACRGDNDVFCYLKDKRITPDNDMSYACDDYDYVGFETEPDRVEVT